MSKYDDLKNKMQELYDAAQAELQALEQKRQEVTKDIEYLGQFVGTAKPVASAKATVAVKSTRGRKPGSVSCKKTAAATKTAAKTEKRARIKEETIRELVCKYLKEAEPNSMSPVEIFERLVKDGMPNTKSFSSRVYTNLTTWAKDGVIQKVTRGVYKAK